jgi:phage shock protein E
MKNILQKATVVDVRTPEEFKDGHYPGAINIPVNEVPKRIDEFKSMQLPIVAYCRSGSRSGMAISILKQNGINDVHNGGGLTDLLQQKNK